ncbi:MAG: hypothetical protein SynsKO_00340 [Synoicihabitans sp.]
MSGIKSLQLAGIVLFLGLGFLGRDLAWAWRHSPYDSGAGWVALIWVLSLVWVGRRHKPLPASEWLVAAVLLGLVGWIGQLNVAVHAALVAAGMAWLPTLRSRLLMGIAGVSWWPALGWFASGLLPVSGLLVGRFLILLAGVGLCLRMREKGTAS